MVLSGFLFFLSPKLVKAQSCWECYKNDQCPANGICQYQTTCGYLACTFRVPGASSGWCDVYSFTETCNQDSPGPFPPASCHRTSGTFQTSCWIGPAPTAPPPGGGGGSCAWCAGDGQCTGAGGIPIPDSSCSNGFCCTGVTPGVPPGGATPTPGPQGICGDACVTTNENCKQPPAAGNPTICYRPPGSTAIGHCANPTCIINGVDYTQPGTICNCRVDAPLHCGQPCAGPCNDGISMCSYVSGPSCSPGSTYCTGNLNGYSNQSKCVARDQGNNYLRGPGGQTSGFTPAQILQSCTPVVASPGWWQVIGGDAVTNGVLQSNIPATCVLPGCNPYFILDGTAGGIPGNAIFGGTTNLMTLNVSSKGWLGNTLYMGRTYDSTYFTNLIPTSVSFNTVGPNAAQADFDGGVASNGYYWYKSNGNLTLTGNVTITGNRKVILFVDGGDFNINGKINIQTKGSGFFMAIVSGNINVGNSVTGVPSIEGLFVSDGTFSTGTGNLPLTVRGTVVGWGGVNLQRDLGVGNNTAPAETFEYAPDFIVLYPRDLVQDRINWQEVIP